MDVNEIRLGHSGEYVLKLLVRVTLEFTYLFGEKAHRGLLLQYLRREYACRIFSKVAMKSLKKEIKRVNVHKFFHKLRTTLSIHEIIPKCKWQLIQTYISTSSKPSH